MQWPMSDSAMADFLTNSFACFLVVTSLFDMCMKILIDNIDGELLCVCTLWWGRERIGRDYACLHHT